MTDANTNWPALAFRFSVQFADGVTATFQEAEGLEQESPRIEYRHGDSPVFTPIKMPGLGRAPNVRLRKGIFFCDSKAAALYDAFKANTLQRQTIRVDLLDEAGKTAMTWTLHNAQPVDVSSTDLKSEGNEVAVESVEIAYETMVIAAP